LGGRPWVVEATGDHFMTGAALLCSGWLKDTAADHAGEFCSVMAINLPSCPMQFAQITVEEPWLMLEGMNAVLDVKGLLLYLPCLRQLKALDASLPRRDG